MQTDWLAEKIKSTLLSGGRQPLCCGEEDSDGPQRAPHPDFHSDPSPLPHRAPLRSQPLYPPGNLQASGLCGEQRHYLESWLYSSPTSSTDQNLFVLPEEKSLPRCREREFFQLVVLGLPGGIKA